jgi:hypothetical protein
MLTVDEARPTPVSAKPFVDRFRRIPGFAYARDWRLRDFAIEAPEFPQPSQP